MPFNQMGFTPYPTAPRRDPSVYQNFGRGFEQMGQGADTMLGSFQEMKERRQRSLMAQQKHESDLEAAKQKAEEQKYILEEKKLSAQRDKETREMLNKQYELAQKERENQAKIALEEKKLAAQPAPTQPRGGADSRGVPQPEPYSLKGPAMSPALQSMSQSMPPAPAPMTPPQRMSLDEVLLKIAALGQDPRKYQTMINTIYRDELAKNDEWKPKTMEEVERLILLKKGKKGYAPETQAQMRSDYLFKQRNKRFQGSSRLPKPEETKEGVTRLLENAILNKKSIEDQIKKITPDRYQAEVRDFMGSPKGTKTLNIQMNRDQAALMKQWRKSRDDVAKYYSYYTQVFEREYTMPAGLGQGFQNPEPGAKPTPPSLDQPGPNPAPNPAPNEAVKVFLQNQTPEQLQKLQSQAEIHNRPIEEIAIMVMQKLAAQNANAQY